MSGPRVLIVDDSPTDRRIIAYHLGRIGRPLQVSEAANSAEALRLAASADLILVDLRLADEDGLALCRTLIGGVDPGRIVLMSGVVLELDRSEAGQLGIRRFVDKDELTPAFLSTLLNDARGSPECGESNQPS